MKKKYVSVFSTCMFYRTPFDLTAFAGSIAKGQRLITLMRLHRSNINQFRWDASLWDLELRTFCWPHKTIPDKLHWIGIFHFTKVNLSPVKDLQMDRGTAKRHSVFSWK